MRFLLCLLLFAAAAAAQPTGTIEGRVVATDGSPVPRATVRLQGMSQGGATSTVYIELTDKNGAFRVEKVPVGSYIPMATHPGYQGSTGAVPVPVSVTEGKTASGVQIRLARLGSVSGVVVDADGAPVEGVQVSLLRTNSLMGRLGVSQAGAALTDDQGQFRIANAQPGRYRLQAILNSSQFGPGPGWVEVRGRSARVTDLPTFYPNTTDMEKATAINLQAQAITGLKLQMRRGRTYRVQGMVTNAPNAPARVSVMVNPKSGTNGIGVGVGANGEFVINGLAPGEYVLIVRGSEPGAAQMTGRAEITVKDADLTNVNLRLMTPQELTGSLKVEGVTDIVSFFAGMNATRPIILRGPAGTQIPSGPMVSLFPAEPGPIGPVQLTVNPDGSFRATAVTAGSYLLNIGNLGLGIFVKQAKLDGKDLTGKRLELGEGKHTLELLLSTASASVTYQLTRPSPMVLWPVVPDLLTQNGNVFLNTGNIITNIPPGEYFVATWEESPAADLARAPDFLRHFNNLATRVTLQPGISTPLQPKMIPRDALQKVLAEF